MYVWRKLNAEQQQRLLTFRKENSTPWHSPVHRISEHGRYLLTAACYEHKSFVGHTPERMSEFSKALLVTLSEQCSEINAWCVLPNHYHVVVKTEKLRDLLKQVAQLHGRTSFIWNGEENARGRKVWCNCAETAIKSDRHFWATLNYVHHNPVRHGYAKGWQDWPISSATSFVEKIGRDEAAKLWHAYPLLDYGKDWDAPEM